MTALGAALSNDNQPKLCCEDCQNTGFADDGEENCAHCAGVNYVEAEMEADLVDQAEHEVMRERLRHLSSCNFLPGSPHKRFVNDVWRKEPAALTMKQHDHVMRLAWRYRRQMPAHLVPKSDPDAPMPKVRT